MRELARGTRKSQLKCDIEAVPAFRQHLARNGLRNLAEFEARNQATGQVDGALLDLRYRYSKVRPGK
jgi:hypothetical protein